MQVYGIFLFESSLKYCFSLLQPYKQVVVKCPRTGGAFGGKIFRGVPVSCAAALAATKLGRPVRIFNTRTADMAQQSKCVVRLVGKCSTVVCICC